MLKCRGKYVPEAKPMKDTSLSILTFCIFLKAQSLYILTRLILYNFQKLLFFTDWCANHLINAKSCDNEQRYKNA